MNRKLKFKEELTSPYHGPMNTRAIALQAGVSRATVSRVINGLPGVKQEKAQRVRDVLERVNFIPNPVATTLRYGRSKTYGLIIPDIRNPFYSEFLVEFEDLVLETDHEVLLTNVPSSSKLVKSVRRMLMRQVDGAVFMASEFDTHDIEPLFLHKVPLVTVDRRSVQAGCSDVAIDFEGGYLQAVHHLRDLGHKRLGYIGGSEGLRTSNVRAEAFKVAVQNSGLRYYPNLVRAGDYRVTGGERAIASLFKETTPPTAILTANDLTAFGAIRGLHQMGLNVPKDVSLVGLDDVLLADVLQPPLTTIRIPRRRMAETCLKALNHTKKDVERRGARYSVPVELVIRESTAQVTKSKR
jgi:DNA-binding LacI/PurR family transcriptional regulator